jgi:hypothetical protein
MKAIPCEKLPRNWRSLTTLCTTPFIEQGKLALTRIERGVGGHGAQLSKRTSTYPHDSCNESVCPATVPVPSLGPAAVMSKPLSSPPCTQEQNRWTFQNAIAGKAQLWKLCPLFPVEEREGLSFLYVYFFSTLNFQPNSNYVTTKIFDMALRYGARCARNAHRSLWLLIGLMGSSLQQFCMTLNVLLDKCVASSSGYYTVFRVRILVHVFWVSTSIGVEPHMN